MTRRGPQRLGMAAALTTLLGIGVSGPPALLAVFRRRGSTRADSARPSTGPAEIAPAGR